MKHTYTAKHFVDIQLNQANKLNDLETTYHFKLNDTIHQ